MHRKVANLQMRILRKVHQIQLSINEYLDNPSDQLGEQILSDCDDVEDMLAIYQYAIPPDSDLENELDEVGEFLMRIKRGMSSAGKSNQRLKLKQMNPEDLPRGVTTRRGFSEYGPCYEFEHNVLGHLGRIILIPISENQMELRSEMKEQDKCNVLKEGFFKEIVGTISKTLGRY